MSHRRDELVTGLVGGSHGIRGELKIRSLSGETEHFIRLQLVTLRKGITAYEYRVEAVRRHGKNVLLKLAGVDDPETARQLTGYEIWVPREMAAPCRADEYYVADLVGMRLTHCGGVVATVQSVWDNGVTPMLEVLTTEQRIAIVPFQDRFVGEVRLASGEIELQAPWVLE